MTTDLRSFWQRFQTGITVAVGGDVPDKLLGVREGFLRYFHQGLHRPVSVSVSPQALDETATPLPLTDVEILELARARAAELERRLGDGYAFYVGSEAGLLTFEAGSESRNFVRNWTVVRGLGDEAWGTSGSVQLPERLIRGLDEADLPFAIPGRHCREKCLCNGAGQQQNNQAHPRKTHGVNLPSSRNRALSARVSNPCGRRLVPAVRVRS